MGLLQGASELFPVSSLGHAVLVPSLLHWTFKQSDPSFLPFLVLLHLGTATALLVLYRDQWVAIISGFFTAAIRGQMKTDSERLAMLLLVGTIPAAVLGVFLESRIKSLFASPYVAAGFLVVNGLVLFGAQRLMRRSEVRALARREGVKRDGGRRLETLEYREGGILGVAQSGGLIAGISRDGMVMAGGLARGLDNSDAARMSFLMATPIILAAGVYKLPDLTGPNGNGIRGYALLAAVAAAVTAVFTVHFLTRYFKTGNLIPFGIYCVLFGTAMVIYNA